MSVSVTSDLNLLNLPASDLSGIDVITRDGFSGTWVGFAAGVSARKPRNVGMGYRLMTSSRDAAQNTAMGYSVAERLTGDNNVLMGAYVAQRVVARLTENVIIGTTAAQYVSNPLYRNVWIGYGQGFSNSRTSSNCIGIGADGSALGNRVINIGTVSTADGSGLISIGHDSFVNEQNNIVIGNRITNIASNCLIIKTNHNDLPWVNSNSDYLNINDVLISERLDDGSRRATLSNEVLRFKSALTSITLSNTFVSLDGVQSQISLGDIITFRGLYSSMVLDKDITFSGCNTSLILAESGIVSYNGKDASLTLGSNIVYLQGSNATDIAVLGSNTGLLINSNSISLVGSNARDIIIAGSNSRLVLSSNIQLIAPKASSLTLVSSNAGLYLSPTAVSLCNTSATSLGLVGSNASLILSPSNVFLNATEATSIRFTGASNTTFAITPSNISMSGPSATSISLVASNNTRLLITPGQMGMIGPSTTLLSLTGCNMSFDMSPSNITLSAPNAGRYTVLLSNNTQLSLTSNLWNVSGPNISNLTMSGASNILWRTTPSSMIWQAPTSTRMEISLSNMSFVADTIGNKVDMISSNADPMRFVASNSIWSLGSRTLTGCNVHPEAIVGWVGPYGASWTLDASNARLIGSNLNEASMILSQGETLWRMNPQTLEWIGSNATKSTIIVGSNGSGLTINANTSNPSAYLYAANAGNDIFLKMTMESNLLDWRIDRASPTFLNISPSNGLSWSVSSNVSHQTNRSSITTTGPGIRSWSVSGNPAFSWNANYSNVALNTPEALRWTLTSSNAYIDVIHDQYTKVYHEREIRFTTTVTEDALLSLDDSNIRLVNSTGGSNISMSMTGSNTTFVGPVIMENDPVIRGQTFSNWLAQATPSTLSNLTVTGTLNVPGNAVIQTLTVNNLTALSNNIVITTVQMSSNTVTGFSNGVQVIGNGTFDSNVYIRGSLIVDGPVTFSNPSFIATGMLSMSGAGSIFRIDPPAQLIVGGNASFTGPCNVSISGTGQFTVSTLQPTIFRNSDVVTQCNLIVSGNDAIIQRRLTVNGNTTFFSPIVSIRSNLNIDGTTTLAGPLNVINGSPTTFGGPVSFLQPTSFCNDVLILGITAMSNDVRISGAIESRSNIRSYGTLDQYGAAFFWSNVFMHRSLTVNGSATLCNSLNTSGTATFRSNVNLDQTLSVSGLSTFSGPLISTGTYATFCNPVNITQTLSVTSNVNIQRGDVLVNNGSTFTVSDGPVLISGTGASFTVSNSSPSTFFGTVDTYDRVKNWCNVDNFGMSVFYNSNTTVCNVLDVFGQLNSYSGLVVSGGPLISSNDFIALGALSRVDGQLNVEGNIITGSDVIVRSNLTVEQGNFTVSVGDAQFQGNSVEINGVLRTFSNAFFFSNVDAFSDMTVWQRFEARGTGPTAFIVSRGDATFSNAAYVGGSFSAGINNPNAIINIAGRNMTVTTSNVLFSNHRFEVIGPLYARSNTFIDSRLVVSSNVTFSNDLLVGRNVAITSNLSTGGSFYVAGPTTLSNTLDVTGSTANFWSNVFVNGILTANQLVTFSNVIQQTIVQIVGSNTTFSNDVVFLGKSTFSNIIISTSNFTTTGLTTLCNDLRVFGNDNRINGAVTLANGSLFIDRSNVLIDSNSRLIIQGGPNEIRGELGIYDTLHIYSNVIIHPPGGLLTVPALDINGPLTVQNGPVILQDANINITGSNSTLTVNNSNTLFKGSNTSILSPQITIGDQANPSSIVTFPRGFTVTDGPVVFQGTRDVTFNVPLISRCNVTLCNGLSVQGGSLTTTQDIVVGQNLIVNGTTTLCNSVDILSGARIRSNLTLDGSLLARSNVTISNSLNVIGSTTLTGGPVQILSPSGPFLVVSPATFCNDLQIKGNTIISSNLQVDQNIVANKDLTIASSNGRLIVLGSEARFNSNTFVNVFGPFNVSGPSTFSNITNFANTVSIYSNLNVSADSIFQGKITASNDLLVAGVSDFMNNVNIQGSLFGYSPWTLCNDFISASSNANSSFAGNVFINQALQVQGLITACNGAQINGSVRIAPNAINDQLLILTPATFCNNINVTGPGAIATVSNLVIKGITTIGDPSVATEADDVVTIIPVAPTVPQSNTTLNNNGLVGTAVVRGNIVFSNDVTIVGNLTGLGNISNSNPSSNPLLSLLFDNPLSFNCNVSFLGGISVSSNISYCNISTVTWNGTPSITNFNTNITWCNNCNLTLTGPGTLDIRTSNTQWRSNIEWYSGGIIHTRGNVTVSNQSNLIRFTGDSNGRMDLDQDVSIRDLTVRDTLTLSNIAWEGGIIAFGASNETLRAWSNVPDALQHRFDGSVIIDSNLYLGGRLFANGFTMTVIETLRAELQDLIVSGTMTLCNTTVEGVLTIGHCNGPPLIYSNIPDLVQHRTEGTLIVDSNLYVAGRIFCQGIEWSAAQSMNLYDAIFYGTATFCNTDVEGILRIGGSNNVYYAFSNIPNNVLNTFQGAVLVEEDLYVSGKLFCNGIEWTTLNNQVINDAVIKGKTTFCNAVVDGFFILGSNGPYTAWNSSNLIQSNSLSHQMNGALIVEEDLYVGGKVFANGLNYTWCNVINYITSDIDVSESLTSRCNTHLFGEVAIDSNAKITFQTSNVLFTKETQHRGDIQIMSEYATLPSWTISLSNDTPLVSDLVFKSKNDTILTMTDDFTSSLLNFTGKHICRIIDEEKSLEDSELIGKIVITTGDYDNLDGVTDLTRDQMDEAVPIVRICNRLNDSRVLGVIGSVERVGTPRQYKIGNLGFKQPSKLHSSTRVVVHSLGEGVILVDDTNGSISNGDLLTTSSNGYATKQQDDIIRSYTVAKATCDCPFSSNSTVKMIGCIYKC